MKEDGQRVPTEPRALGDVPNDGQRQEADTKEHTQGMKGTMEPEGLVDRPNKNRYSTIT